MKDIKGYYPLFSLIFIFIVDFSLIVSTHYSWDDSMKRYLPLQKEVSRLAVELSQAYVSLEEAIAGEPYIDVEEDVMLPLSHQSFKLYYAQAQDTLGKDCDCLRGLRELSKRLIKFENISKHRWESRAISGRESKLDQEFDKQYQGIINIVDIIHHEIDQKIKEEITSRNQTFKIILFFFVVMNILAFIILYLAKKKENKMSNLLNHRAHYDTLTGLANRELYLDRLGQAIRTAQREKTCLAVVFLDLDGFKTINDTKGHHIGDIVLKEIGSRLLENVRSADTVSRFGGDEFTLLLNAVNDDNDIDSVLDKVMKSIRLPMVIDGEAYYLTMSIGIALYSKDGSTDDELLKNADIAMYHSKEQGKDRYTFYSSLADNEV